MENSVDFTALAALRPGDSRATLAAAMGSRWRAPGPADQGRVMALAGQHGFEAQLDITDHVARLAFHAPFPRDVPVAGLRFAMSPKEALAVQPKLTFGFEMQMHIMKPVYYFADVSDHYRIAAEFRAGELHEISIFDKTAIYPPLQQMAYPAPAGRPGEPFPDPNLKLVVLASLLETGAIDLGRPKDLAEFVLQRPVDLEKEGYGLIPEARDYLQRYPLTAADLAKVETISFDAGNEIYRYCRYFWDGHGDDFTVKSLAGIGRCANLRVLNDIAMLETVDVAHLVGLNRLEEVELSFNCRHAARLLELPALRKLSFHRPAIGDLALIARLKQRGVAVRIYD
jgi:hypothetical protein